MRKNIERTSAYARIILSEKVHGVCHILLKGVVYFYNIIQHKIELDLKSTVSERNHVLPNTNNNEIFEQNVEVPHGREQRVSEGVPPLEKRKK